MTVVLTSDWSQQHQAGRWSAVTPPAEEGGADQYQTGDTTLRWWEPGPTDERETFGKASWDRESRGEQQLHTLFLLSSSRWSCPRWAVLTVTMSQTVSLSVPVRAGLCAPRVTADIWLRAPSVKHSTRPAGRVSRWGFLAWHGDMTWWLDPLRSPHQLLMLVPRTAECPPPLTPVVTTLSLGRGWPRSHLISRLDALD